MGALRYADFELKIEKENDRYVARVIRSPGGEASSTFVLPFSDDRLENLVLKIGRLRHSTRCIHSAETEAARELGGQLFEAVFSGEVRSCLRTSLDRVSSQEGMGLRLKLRLQEVANLANLPWEFLFDRALDRFLAQSNQTPIVRYIELPQRIRPLSVSFPLRLLVMISSPVDYIRLDVEREKAMLAMALDPLIQTGKVEVEWVEKASLGAIQRCLRDGEYHVFHFIGHGGFDQKADEGALVLEDEKGNGWLVEARRIGTLLHDHRPLRLAVLNSCEGGRNSRTDPFAGTASTLIRQGIPAVVAMQFEISDDAAITFATEFYASLAAGLPVDAAVAETRKAIYARPNDVEWGTPVLYMRSTDGVLFKLPQGPSAKGSAAPGRAAVPAPRKAQHTAEEPTLTVSVPVKPPLIPPLEPATPTPPPVRPEPAHPPVEADITSTAPQLILPVISLAGEGRINCAAFSPDREMLVTGSLVPWALIGKPNPEVCLWRVADGKLLFTLKKHTNTVTDLAFSPDGALLASASEDETVCLWRTSDGKFLRTLKPPGQGGWVSKVSSVAFSSDGAMLATGSSPKTVCLWRVADGELLQTIEEHTTSVECVAFSPDGTMLASGSIDKTVRLYLLRDERHSSRTLQGHTQWVNCVAFSPDGAMLASGAKAVFFAPEIRLWRVADGKFLSQIVGHHDEGIRSLAFSPDRTMLASGADNKKVCLFRLPEGKHLHTLEHASPVKTVAFSADATVLLSATEDKSVRRWRLK